MPHDLFLEESYSAKKLKYHSLITASENIGYKCQLIVPGFGSLGHVYRLAVRGLFIGGQHKTKAKVQLNISNYRKHVYLEQTMFPLPLNCKTHNGLLTCLNWLDYSENST